MSRRAPDPAAVRVALRAFDVAVRAFPAALRRRQGTPMRRAFLDAARQRHRRGGAGAVVRGTLADLADLLWSGVAARLEGSRARGSAPSRRRSPPHRRLGGTKDVLSELKYALRQLGKRPTFAIVAILTLGIAVAANALIFAVVDGVLLKPLPYPEAERLVVVGMNHPTHGGNPVSLPDYADFRDRAASFESTAAYWHWGYTFTGGDEPLDVPALRTTPSLFDVLGVKPALGRTI